MTVFIKACSSVVGAAKCGWGSDNEACSLVVGGFSAATKVGGAQIIRLVAQCGTIVPECLSKL